MKRIMFLILTVLLISCEDDVVLRIPSEDLIGKWYIHNPIDSTLDNPYYWDVQFTETQVLYNGITIRYLDIRAQNDSLLWLSDGSVMSVKKYKVEGELLYYGDSTHLSPFYKFKH